VGICGPIGPTEQLPLVARLVNELGLDLRHAHFSGMDEWYEDGRAVPVSHPLSFERADRELCFDRIRPELRMPEANLHFPKADVADYVASWGRARCAVMQGGQGDIKHWAFKDPLKRDGKYADSPPTAAEYRTLSTHVVDLHPVNHHVHLHACVTDGVFVPGTHGPDGPPAFLSARPLTAADLAAVGVWLIFRQENVPDPFWAKRDRHRLLAQTEPVPAVAADMLAWENSGFSVDASVRITLIDRDVPSYFIEL